jgi:membrane dipeptidase
MGIGFWDTATGGADVGSIARAIAYAANLAGVEHVALGSDFDGGVTVPIDATGLVQITDALLDLGWDEASIGRIMGRNALRLLADVLPG